MSMRWAVDEAARRRHRIMVIVAMAEAAGSHSAYPGWVFQALRTPASMTGAP
jgi:hypothetical protein